MQSSAQEVTMLSKLIAAAKDSWACFLGTIPRIPLPLYKHFFEDAFALCYKILHGHELKAGILISKF